MEKFYPRLGSTQPQIKNLGLEVISNSENVAKNPDHNCSLDRFNLNMRCENFR